MSLRRRCAADARAMSSWAFTSAAALPFQLVAESLCGADERVWSLESFFLLHAKSTTQHDGNECRRSSRSNRAAARIRAAGDRSEPPDLAVVARAVEAFVMAQDERGHRLALAGRRRQALARRNRRADAPRRARAPTAGRRASMSPREPRVRRCRARVPAERRVLTSARRHPGLPARGFGEFFCPSAREWPCVNGMRMSIMSAYRAFLLASATATMLGCRRCRILPSHRLPGSCFSRTRPSAARAPWISKVRR